MIRNQAPFGDVARVRLAPPDRLRRVRAYLAEMGDPGGVFGGPVEVQARFTIHDSPLRPLAERQNADY